MYKTRYFELFKSYFSELVLNFPRAFVTLCRQGDSLTLHSVIDAARVDQLSIRIVKCTWNIRQA